MRENVRRALAGEEITVEVRVREPPTLWATGIERLIAPVRPLTTPSLELTNSQEPRPVPVSFDSRP